ncbi:MAG: DUF3857 domain-containing protein [Balneolaceae bacterium]|nr:DUF3857 domain-containing protein [Balneolaceae bacterium]
MPRTLYILVILCVLLPVGATAQQTGELPEASFGSVPDSLLAMERYRPQPGAPYIIAHKEVDISFRQEDQSIVALLDYYVRIKIFNGEAKQASVVAVPYYFDNEIEQVLDIRGYTHLPGGGRHALDQNAIRTINLNARYNVKEFTMPAIEDGAVLEYAYTIERKYIEELPDFYIAHRVPTALARASISYPRYLRYEVDLFDYNGKVEHLTEQVDTSSVPKVFSIPQPEPVLREHWIARQVPAVEEEAYITNLDDFRGKLKFKLDEFGLPRQKLENSWELVVAQIRQTRSPLKRARESKQAREMGRSIAEAFASKKEAQDSVYRYLNSRMRFNESKQAFSEQPADSVLGGALADQAAINQTLLAMLQGAGIEAWPLLISTRQFGRINRSFPSYFQFNGLLVYSQIDGESYFMDASFPQSHPSLIPVSTYNETGLVLKPDSYEWVEISPDRSLFSIHIDLKGALTPDGDLEGSIHSESAGYPAQLIRQRKAAGEPENKIIRDALFDRYSDIQITRTRIENLDHYGRPVRIEADFVIEQYATSFRDGLEFQPLVVGSLPSNPFHEGTRRFPITLDAPEELELHFEIAIPRGFQVERGLESQQLEIRGARLQERYRSEGRTISYEYNIELSRKNFEPSLYPQLLDLYERWVTLSNMSWLIKRAS